MGGHEERHSEGPQREKEAGDRGLVTEAEGLRIPPAACSSLSWPSLTLSSN